MTNETVYQAIFETEKYRVFIEYEPGPDGVIFIENITIEARPISQFEQREQERQRLPKQEKNRWIQSQEMNLH